MKYSFLKGFFYSKVFPFLGAVMLAFLVAGIARGYLQKRQVNQEVESLKREIAKLESGNAELNSLIEYLQTTSFLEEEARKKFGLAREGESLLIISPPEEGVGQDEFGGVMEENKKALSNSGRWWYYFW